MPERLNRDEMRTPMQWDASAHARFCPDGVSPWLPVNPDYRRVNVASQRSDPDSMLALYRRLFALRREHESLRTGSLALLETPPPEVLGYRRNDIIVLANLGEELATVRYTGEVLADTGRVAVGAGRTTLFPDSAVVLRTVVPRVAGDGLSPELGTGRILIPESAIFEQLGARNEVFVPFTASESGHDVRAVPTFRRRGEGVSDKRAQSRQPDLV